MKNKWIVFIRIANGNYCYFWFRKCDIDNHLKNKTLSSYMINLPFYASLK